MRVAVTGTPGTGKTTATERLDSDFDVVHLNEVIRDHGFTTGEDAERGSAIADFEAVAAYLDGRDDVVFESHLAHNFDADRVVVLRCAPNVLERRLLERGEGEASARENAESEALDVVLTEAMQRHEATDVYEIDCTELEPDEVAAEIDAVVDGERTPGAGTVSFIDYLE